MIKKKSRKIIWKWTTRKRYIRRK